MADELVRLTTAFAGHGAETCREFRDVASAQMHDLFIGEISDNPASGAGRCTILFKPTGLYEELMVAAWTKAAQLDVGIVNARGLSTHEHSPISLGGP